METSIFFLNLRSLFFILAVLIMLFAPKIGLVANWKDKAEWPVITHVLYALAGLCVFGFGIWMRTDPDGAKATRVFNWFLRFLGITL